MTTSSVPNTPFALIEVCTDAHTPTALALTAIVVIVVVVAAATAVLVRAFSSPVDSYTD